MSNQERRLMRRMGVGGNQQTLGGLYLPQGAYSPQDEQDAKRDRLAERLLEIGLENLYPSQFVDTEDGPEDSPTQTVKDWFTRVAEASISAAEVIYPELPSADDAPMIWRGKPPAPAGWVLPGDLPTAAQEGVRTVDGQGSFADERGEG